MIETFRCNDVLVNLYNDIHLTIKEYDDIGNLMVYYLYKILYIIKSDKYKNKNLMISKTLEKLYNDLIKIYYNEDIDEIYKIKQLYLRLYNIKNDGGIINKHIKLIEKL